MESNKELATQNTQLEKGSGNDALKDFRMNCEKFHASLNKDPAPESIDSTPDGKAKTVVISHVEMLLDEYFFGLWSTENFRWERLGNEVVGSIDLVVIHPVTNTPIRRTGAASIQIMVDRVPDNIKHDNQTKNAWNLNMENKKPNALDMGFPKLKAECEKNAAISLGKLFGRDINRKKADNYQPLLTRAAQAAEARKAFQSQTPNQ